MEATKRFSHGSYGDESGVVFSSGASNVSSSDHLAISDRFIGPLFSAIIDQSHSETQRTVPRLVAEWNSLSGWTEHSGRQLIDPVDVNELAQALARVSAAQVQRHVAGTTPEECVECALVIAGFLREQLANELPLYIEDD